VKEELIDRDNFLVLWRDTPKGGTDRCFFCGKKHYHGTTDGHRRPHCVKVVNKEISLDGKTFKHSDGYVVRTRSKGKLAYERHK
jgi:hypothetical protein